MSNTISCSGRGERIVTSRGPVAVTSQPFIALFRLARPSPAISRSSVNTTSSAVNDRPEWNVTPSRSVRTMIRLSSRNSHAVASTGWASYFSSTSRSDSSTLRFQKMLPGRPVK
jgi:hypothetical protein